MAVHDGALARPPYKDNLNALLDEPAFKCPVGGTIGSKRNVVYTNFQDEPGELEEVALTGASNGHDLVRYRENIRAYLTQHQDDASIQHLRRNKQLTALDLSELERILLESGLGSRENLDRAAAAGLGLYVRSLVGADRDAHSRVS